MNSDSDSDDYLKILEIAVGIAIFWETSDSDSESVFSIAIPTLPNLT